MRIEVKIETLQPETEFLLRIDALNERRGRVIYLTPSRAYVEIFGAPKVKKFVTRRGDSVEFLGSGSRDTSWALETLVEVEVSCA